jgi:hypothetical protein
MGQISRITFDDGRKTGYGYDKLSRLLQEEYKTAQESLLNKYEYTYDQDGNRLTKTHEGSPSRVVNYASDRDASSPGFNESNQLKKVWTPGTNMAGDKINVAGTITEENLDWVEVTPNDTPAKKVTAEVRDGLFIARNVELNDSDSNTVEATARDKAGNTPAQTSERTGIKLDKNVDIKFWFEEEIDEYITRGEGLGDVVVKEQVFNYGGDDDTQTTKYYYNQARMLEYVDLAERATRT